MDDVVAWCGFLGAWLLFAGPVYQAAIELREEAIEQEEMERMAAAMKPIRMSPWWWLLPPVAYVMAINQRKRRQDEFIHLMSDVQKRRMFNFKTKAHGWIVVAGGAFLIAVKETYELREAYEWPIAVFWILVVVAPLLGVLNTSARMARAKEMLDQGFAGTLDED
ncbi:MAG: hypothetical protein AAGC46_11185 [Solirubrobacteraceae bacterium]|nr:hypothetical protein [Patulibacter sp.]